jgi:hypothetical protein
LGQGAVGSKKSTVSGEQREDEDMVDPFAAIVLTTEDALHEMPCFA